MDHRLAASDSSATGTHIDIPSEDSHLKAEEATPPTGAASRRFAPAGVIAALLIVTYGATFSLLTVLKHQTWHSYFWDLGIFDQVIWNTAQGRFLESSFYSYGPSYLGEHLSLILAVFAPFYWIWDDVRVLLVVQSLYIASGGWPVYLLAKKRLRSRAAPVFLTAAFLLFPNIAYVNLFDFHPETLLVPLLPWAFYFLETRRDGLFLAIAGLSLLVKEDAGLIVFALGAYAAIFRGRRFLGTGLTVLGLGWFIAAMYWVIPYFRGQRYLFLDFYGHLGTSAPEILLNLVTHPLNTIGLVLTYQKLYYLFQLLSPTAFLPLLNPAVGGIALPILAGNLLSSAAIQTDILHQYSISTGPIFVVATIGAILFISSKAERFLCPDCYARNVPNMHLGLALVVLLFSVYAFGRDNPIGHYSGQSNFIPRPNQAALEEAKGLVPRDASLLVSNMLGAQFTHREDVFFFPPIDRLARDPGADYVLVDLTDWDVGQPGGIRGQLAQAAPAAQYQVLLERDNVILLKRR